MIRSLRRLSTTLNYLRIEREGKLTDEVFLPLLLATATFAFFYLLDWNVQIFGSSGLISAIVGLLQMVAGFYIASLAAVATFKKASMDDPMPGAPTVLHVRRRNRIKEEQLSRRRFLCFLFGYLSFLSFFLYLLGTIMNLAAPEIELSLSSEYHGAVKWVGTFVFLFIFYNLIITTLLGLYYMTDRIHRSAAVVQEKNPSQQSDLEDDEL